MPRQEHIFIPRSTAINYHIVHQPISDDWSYHVLVSDDGNKKLAFVISVQTMQILPAAIKP